MNDYYALRLDVEPCSADATDLLAYLLGEAGYESFVPDDKGLTAYVPAALYSDEAVRTALEEFCFDATVTASAELVEGRDWNAEWERNYFRPIVVGERCVVHSSFHTDVPKAEYDIVIDPKMAFGTGHHATTSLILTRLLDMDLQGRSFIDVGTGTGILAILAAMRGAVPVAGIEIDRFAWENACDNVRLNGHPEIAVLCGDASLLQSLAPADVVVANINRNVILGDIRAYAAAMHPGATLLLSGFYEADCAMVEEAAVAAGLTATSRTVRDNWACVELHR
ncbi:MAG: 50S ribosomal protein L11 methyltransferase [Muribaculaceae bacterium]|nr:50S ribosomal protein L11 methyltransferase [Muribaculaceae bacterium]MBP3639460.1 50S ribosomal protein L11 methyltransferase [Muribaculaceae bacterium]